MEWYYSQDGQPVGPVNEDQFNALVRTGVITAGTSVWREGMADWQAYEKVAPAHSRPDNPLGAGSAASGALPFDTSELERALAKVSAESQNQDPPVDMNPRPASGLLNQTLLDLEEKISEAEDLTASSPSPDAEPESGRDGGEKAEDEIPLPEPAPVSKLAYEIPPWESPPATAPKPVKSQAQDDPKPVDAGFGIRAAALAVDGLILIFLYFAVDGPFIQFLSPFKPDDYRKLFVEPPARAFFELVLFVLYFAVFVDRLNATPGQLLFGLRVVNPDGSRVPESKAWKRACGQLLSLAVLTAGYLWALRDAQGRTWHDLLSGTKVVRKPSRLLKN